jgi:hypothetical protein
MSAAMRTGNSAGSSSCVIYLKTGFSNCCEVEVSPFAVLVVNYFTGSNACSSRHRATHTSISVYLVKKKVRVPFSQRLGWVYVASLTKTGLLDRLAGGRDLSSAEMT